ncbi:MAG: ABC transporter permease, partial [Planctomycetes bacterium]|nr:ABC transporter permease [Planctomycetota bacterium]
MDITTLETWLEPLGDRINPILVKETRQALKSRQFLVTFLLLLVASLLVSFGGVAIVGPDLGYRSAGVGFFIAYYAVLAFAVFVVVPFGAYRSLASEQEERTFELLSITTLRPRQIVAGKLLSAVVQMFI